MTHGNAPLSVEGRRRLVARCADRPIAHVAAEMGISRACASKWVNRFRRFGELGLEDRSSAPRRQPTATPAGVVSAIEAMRRHRKWSAARIAFELNAGGVMISRRTVSRHLMALGLNRRRFIDPDGDCNRTPRRIIARRPGHMVHVHVKKVGRIPVGGGWRVHGKDSPRARTVKRATAAGTKAGYVYLHSAVDGYSRLTYTDALDDEKTTTAIGFMHRARVWFAAHGIDHIQRIVTDNGSCFRAKDFAHVLHGARHQFITPTPRATTARWSDTTGSWPRSSSTHGRGSQKPTEPERSRSGTSTSTTIDHTLPPAASHQHPDFSPASPTSWHRSSSPSRQRRALAVNAWPSPLVFMGSIRLQKWLRRQDRHGPFS
jgi:transposase